MEVRTTATESWSWCQNNVGMPCGPVQLAAVVNQPKTWARKDTSTDRLRPAA